MLLKDVKALKALKSFEAQQSFQKLKKMFLKSSPTATQLVNLPKNKSLLMKVRKKAEGKNLKSTRSKINSLNGSLILYVLHHVHAIGKILITKVFRPLSFFVLCETRSQSSRGRCKNVTRPWIHFNLLLRLRVGCLS